MLNEQQVFDRLFHALADASRRSMIERLGRGEATVKELAQPLSMSLPSVLQHLDVLQTAGLVQSEKRGRVRVCVLKPDALDAAEDWFAHRRRTWERKFDRLEAFLENSDEEESNE